MLIEHGPVTLTTDASGNCTAYTSGTVRGFVYAIKYAAGTLANTADLVITGETTGVAILTDSPAASEWFYPRAFGSQATDGAAGTSPDHLVPVFHERIKIVVAQGGTSVTGTITFYTDEYEGHL